MNRGGVAALLCAAAVATGTWLDARRMPPAVGDGILVADLHVHPFPGDGALTVGQLRREARRRGIDVVAVTAHNNRAALDLDEAAGSVPGPARTDADVIVLPGQEITARGFHLIAVGTGRLVDWRLPVPEMVAEIHRQGGAAVAAHPFAAIWTPSDEASLAALDGAERAHPMAERSASWAEELGRFFESARQVNADLAPIGSTDFHTTAPLGRCRTYLLVEERSARAAIDAIRRGTTVAEDADGRLYGRPKDVEKVEAFRASRGARPGASPAEQAAAAVALAALALASLPRQRRE